MSGGLIFRWNACKGLSGRGRPPRHGQDTLVGYHTDRYMPINLVEGENSMKKIMGLALCLALVVPMSAFAVGAIAVDDEEGDKASDAGYYVVTGEDSESAAKKAAMKGCKDLGLKNCKIGVWFTKCGAYASSRENYGYGTGKTKLAATNSAIDNCGQKSCQLVAAECD